MNTNNEQLEAAKNWYKIAKEQNNNVAIEILENMFPELKESEDEKIRKELLQIAKESEDSFYMAMTPDKRKRLIAWLEKQKAIDVLDEEEREFADNVDSYRKEIDAAYQKGYNEGVKATLEKQGEQSNWKPSKDEMDALYGLAYITNKMDDKKDEAITKLYQDLKREFFNGVSYENMFPSSPIDSDINIEKQGNLMKALQISNSRIAELVEEKYNLEEKLEKQGEQKVSEYDIVKTIKERIIEHFDNHLIIDKCFSIGGLKDDILKIINEVRFSKQGEQKPIIEMITPEESLGISSEEYNKIIDDCIYGNAEQNHAWSEEDEEMLNLIIARLHSHPNVGLEEYSKEYSWLIYTLKSLRPQNTWKPSDAQMASITCAVRKMKESACYDSELVSLFNDLKKLREG